MFLTKEKVQELQAAKIDLMQELLLGTGAARKLTKFGELFAKKLPPLQELHDKEIDEKIEKFARLFPKGTEVTRRLCELYPDVFNFGPLGVLLIPNCDHKAYDGKLRKAYRKYIMTPRHKSHRQWSEKEIIQYYNLELALIFYETSIKVQ